MSRLLNVVMVMTVLVVAFFSLKPIASNADFNDSQSAQVMITFNIPDEVIPTEPPIPEVVVPVPEPEPEVVPEDVPTDEPSSEEPPAEVQPDPVIVEPTPDPVVIEPPVPDPVVTPEEPPAVEEVGIVEAPVVEEASVVEVEPLLSELSTPDDLEGITNEEATL